MIRWGAATPNDCYTPANERRIVERTGCVAYREGGQNVSFVINMMFLGIEGTGNGRAGKR